jgi:hypothetical protein
MDLTTLITACALTVDPKVKHALIWRQSGGEPWSFTVSGQHAPHVHHGVDAVVGAARAMRPDAALRIGLTGVPATPRSVTAATFDPCANIAAAARQIAQLAGICRTSRAKDDPTHCAVAAWRGAWERPDISFADAVRTSVANDDAPDFEMPSGTTTAGVDAPRRPPHDDETAPVTAPADDERARLSPLFPAAAKPFESASNGTSASKRTAAGEPKSDVLTVRLTASQPHADGLFVPRSVQQSGGGSE